MLTEKGVSFDPDILLLPDWREKLGDSFTNSYEMQTTLITENKIKGVQIADTVVLPEQVELTGDLVVIANTLVYEGRNPVIEGVGKNVYIFPIIESFTIGKTFEAEMRRQGISSDSIPEKGQRIAEKYTFKDKVQKGGLTIKVNGQGAAEWRKAKEERGTGNQYTQNLGAPEGGINCPRFVMAMKARLAELETPAPLAETILPNRTMAARLFVVVEFLNLRMAAMVNRERTF